jgi:hypothetical protein
MGKDLPSVEEALEKLRLSRMVVWQCGDYFMLEKDGRFAICFLTSVGRRALFCIDPPEKDDTTAAFKFSNSREIDDISDILFYPRTGLLLVQCRARLKSLRALEGTDSDAWEQFLKGVIDYFQ